MYEFMIGAVIQARMGSSRLPNKVMREVLGKPLLAYLIERLRASQLLNRVIVATTTKEEDDPIEALAKQLGIPYSRGSEDDVLDRYHQAAREHGLQHVVRVTSDCPLLDPEILDEVVERYLQLFPDIDYVSNTLLLTYPDGLDVEVFSISFLNRLHRLADKKYQREHVTTYMVENKHLFRCENVANKENLSHHRWTVDYEEDFQLVRKIIEGLYPNKRLFLMEDVISFLTRHPEIAGLNCRIPRNEGFIRSLESQGMSQEEKEKIIRKVLQRSS